MVGYSAAAPMWNKFPDYFKNLSLTSLPAEALPTETFSMGRR